MPVPDPEHVHGREPQLHHVHTARATRLNPILLAPQANHAEAQQRGDRPPFSTHAPSSSHTNRRKRLENDSTMKQCVTEGPAPARSAHCTLCAGRARGAYEERGRDTRRKCSAPQPSAPGSDRRRHGWPHGCIQSCPHLRANSATPRVNGCIPASTTRKRKSADISKAPPPSELRVTRLYTLTRHGSLARRGQTDGGTDGARAGPTRQHHAEEEE
ncbi:hypothetical protein C8J57DRAFT_1512594 [Mycena rebaudengoi]|nr:hypothetical protein C8J57DRAFT_1512594 [Mycena rebaudengoi]